MSQVLLRTFRELPLLTVLLSDPAGLLWGSSRGGGDGAGLAELSLTRYMSTTHVSATRPARPRAFSRTRAKGQRTDFELLAVAGDIQPKSHPGRCLPQRSRFVRALLAEW